ncbi:MAG: hypothetical protein ACRD2Z_00910 [Thermoanaerobaculia bacterium]
MKAFARRVIVTAGLTLAAGLLPQTANAIDFGIRGGLYTDVEEAFVGIELLSRIQRSQWYFNPNVEWVFLENGDLITANIDLHYDFPTSGQFNAWLGGGLAVLFTDPDRGDSDTEPGLNLLAGLGFNPHGVVRPYLQGKIILADDSEAVIAIGLRFF